MSQNPLRMSVPLGEGEAADTLYLRRRVRLDATQSRILELYGRTGS